MKVYGCPYERALWSVPTPGRDGLGSVERCQSFEGDHRANPDCFVSDGAVVAAAVPLETRQALVLDRLPPWCRGSVVLACCWSETAAGTVPWRRKLHPHDAATKGP
jgi:hypothetical protein